MPAANGVGTQDEYITMRKGWEVGIWAASNPRGEKLSVGMRKD
jgi:hypothetical protein